MAHKLINSATFKFNKDCLEKTDPVSETIPGESYSIRELLERAIIGNVPNIEKKGSYAEDPDFDDDDETRRPDFDLADATSSIDELENKFSLEKTKQKIAKQKEIEDLEKEKVRKGKNEPDITASIKAPGKGGTTAPEASGDA